MLQKSSTVSREGWASLLPRSVTYADFTRTISTILEQVGRPSSVGMIARVLASSLFGSFFSLAGGLVLIEAVRRSLRNPNSDLTVDFLDETNDGHPESDNPAFYYQGRVFSQQLSTAIESIAPLAFFNIPILIEGETGTGKKTLAWSIHRTSGVPGGFVCFDCQSCSPATFQSVLSGTGNASDVRQEAVGGTLCLERIEALDGRMQTSLMRVMDEGVLEADNGEVNTRLIATADLPIKQLVSEGKFRQDLYTRLKVGYVELPPLREQLEAILPMFRWFVECVPPQPTSTRTDSFLHGRSEEVCYADDLESVLTEHSWPGNYRELRTCAHGGFVASRLRGNVISGRVVRKYMQDESEKQACDTMPGAHAVDDTESSVQHKTFEVLAALKQGEKKRGESLGAYFRRTGLRGPMRITVGRRIVLAYAKFVHHEQRLARHLGFVEGNPKDSQELEASDVNTNNYTTFLNQLGLKATTVRDPIKLADLSQEEQSWLKRLKRKQVL